jgi:hypothetical protein
MAKLNHSSYDPMLYACYAVVDNKDDFSLYTVHPAGLREFPNYDVYDVGSKSLIAFKEINFHKTDFVYRAVSENQTEEIFCENYEFISDVLENNYDKDKYTFIIMRSAANYDEVVNGQTEPVDASRRCDLESYAALDFYDTNKEGAPDLADRNYLGNDNVLGWTVFLSSMSNIYIVKLRHNHMVDRAYKDWPACSNMAQTFPHIMKMAYQWSFLGEDPWNSNDLIAQKCKLAFDDWNMPVDVIEEIQSSEEETTLSLFLSGDENPRRSIAEQSVVAPKLKQWVMSKIRYRTLGSLQDNYPENLDIPDSMIQKEKQFFETKLYEFCVENKMNPLETTGLELLKYAYQKDPSYREANNTITDIIKKNTYLEDKNEISTYVDELISDTIMGQL